MITKKIRTRSVFTQLMIIGTLIIAVSAVIMIYTLSSESKELLNAYSSIEAEMAVKEVKDILGEPIAIVKCSFGRILIYKGPNAKLDYTEEYIKEYLVLLNSQECIYSNEEYQTPPGFMEIFISLNERVEAKIYSGDEDAPILSGRHAYYTMKEYLSDHYQ
ncbi:hypothetical protein KAI78_11480 [bacterium]|nr:hypothetical protein [bacterium]